MGKGLQNLIELMIDHYARNRQFEDIENNVTDLDQESVLPFDCYGSGLNSDQVLEKVNCETALSRVHFEIGIADHTGGRLQSYKILVNTSRSDVVCTATADDLEMGKMVVCLKHPSN